MTKNECKNQIINFRIAVDNYQRTILNSDYQLSQDAQKRLIPIQQSQLNQTYGRLEKYITKLTKTETAYHTAFLNADQSRVLEAISLVLKDLDYIAGKLESMSDEEFNHLLISQQTASYSEIIAGGGGGGGGGGSGGGRGGNGGSVIFGIPPDKVGIEHVKNPHRQYWEMFLKSIWSWIKNHVSEIIIGLIIAVLATWFGLNR